MDSSSSQRQDFFRYITSGKNPKLINEHSFPLDELIHPLIYSPDIQHHPEILCIPMGYQFHRNYNTFVRSFLKE